MKTYTITIVDENRDSFSETVKAESRKEAEAIAMRIFQRDFSNRLWDIVSVVERFSR